MKTTIAVVCSSDILIEKCLHSFQDDRPVIVVLNFPSDEVLSIVASDPRVTILRHDERNLGLLRQLAVNNCKTEGIIFIDSDCVFSDNSINIIEEELEHSSVVNIPIVFDSTGLLTKIVSQCRLYTTPSHLLLMPLAFRTNIQQSIGSFFNEKLAWGEDSDQMRRLKQANVSYTISKTKVIHKALSIKEDCLSAMRLGKGTYNREVNKLSDPRHIMKDMSIIHEIRYAKECRNTSGLGAAIYHFFIWRPAYKYGYWKTRLKEG